MTIAGITLSPVATLGLWLAACCLILAVGVWHDFRSN